MPIIKSAKKALRQSIKRTAPNRRRKQQIKQAGKAAKTPKNISGYYKLVDKAAKSKTIHKNKAARLKSALAKRLNAK